MCTINIFTIGKMEQQLTNRTRHKSEKGEFDTLFKLEINHLLPH